MATTVHTPVLAYVAALIAGQAVGPSSNITATVNLTGGWELLIPARVQFGSQVSNDPEVAFFPSSDGGANFDSLPMTAFSITNNASGFNQMSIRIPTGMYAIRLRTSGGNTVTFALLTAQLLTAIASN